jgi:hypothetical protein
MRRGEITVVVTTARFREGQSAARIDFRRDPDSQPNRILLGRLDPEFALGYLDEWENFLAPSRATGSGCP